MVFSIIVGVAVGIIIAWLVMTALVWWLLSIPAVAKWYFKWMTNKTFKYLDDFTEEIEI